MKIPKMIYNHQLQPDGSFKILLPKGFYYNDFDQSENLIELEDRNEGNRYWVKAQILFKRQLEIGKEVFLLKNKMVSKATVTHFDSHVKYNRCYLTCHFKISNESPVKFNMDIHLDYEELIN